MFLPTINLIKIESLIFSSKVTIAA